MSIPAPDGGTTTLPPQISTWDIWSLHHRADQIDAAVTAWKGVAKAVKGAADDLDAKAKAVVNGTWEGKAADSFDAHRKQLIESLDDAEAKAGDVAAALDKAAGSIRTAQGHLT